MSGTKKATQKKQRSWTVRVSGEGSEWYVGIYRPDGRFWAEAEPPYTERNKALRAARSLAESGLELKG